MKAIIPATLHEGERVLIADLGVDGEGVWSETSHGEERQFFPGRVVYASGGGKSYTTMFDVQPDGARKSGKIWTVHINDLRVWEKKDAE